MRSSPSASEAGYTTRRRRPGGALGCRPRHARAAGLGGACDEWRAAPRCAAPPRREALVADGRRDARAAPCRAGSSSSLPLDAARARRRCASYRTGSGCWPTTARSGSASRSTRWRCCARTFRQTRDRRAGRSSGCRTASRVTVAGLVVARQRPATAKGVTFMLLEDEWGTINLIVPPPVYQRHRLAVRAEPFVLAQRAPRAPPRHDQRARRRIGALERPDLPLADVKHIEPPVPGETGRGGRSERVAAAAAGDLRAVLPTPHSFGRRGR